ncbi:hypothetical protein [Chengkuizengella sediminis]|uniref:hypothetical protein n=1 Tax=Chengkuizengella sediminis TaxID=1885917 RepID=UPI00138A290F|nr:hypothetical protein [Chengkuizengella sediminis]NDI36125.1 hypothetical protein [Chengkuizengella sediminis]
MDSFFYFFAFTPILIILGALLLQPLLDRRADFQDGDKIPPGYEETNEIFIDPISKERKQVYYNSKNGDRYYRVITKPRKDD